MFAQRQVEVCLPDEYGTGVRELAEAPFTVVCAHARMPGSVERHPFHHQMYAHFVDAAAAILVRAHHTFRPSYVVGK